MFTRLRPLFVFGLMAFAAVAQSVEPEAKQAVVEAINGVMEEKAFVPGLKVDTWPEHLGHHKAALDAAATPDAFVKAINAACREFGVSHMTMRTPNAESRRTSRTMVGLGLKVRDGDSVLHITDVAPDGGAAGVGIEVGDDIVRVDERVPDSPEDLAGPVGSKARLAIRKPDGHELVAEVERRVISLVTPDTLTWINEDSAVLSIHTFAVGYRRDAIAKLAKEAAKARYLLVDLRGNGGGLTNNLRHLLGYFLPPGTAIGTFIGREMAKSYVASGAGDGTDPVAIAAWSDRRFRTDPKQDPVITGRVGVLINRGSASASEITAAALREVLDAPLIGARSAGAVLASHFEKLPGGYSLQYPGSDYVTVKGLRLERHPLVPDLTVESRPESRATGRTDSRPTSRPASRPASRPTSRPLGEDPVVLKALELLRTRVPRPDPAMTASRPTRPESRPDSRPDSRPASRPSRRRPR